MKTAALDSLIKVAQEIYVSDPVPLTAEEAERIHQAQIKKWRDEDEKIKWDAMARRSRLASEYRKQHPFGYNPYEPSPFDPENVAGVLNSVTKAVGTGAKKTWDVLGSAGSRVAGWFKGTLDDHSKIKPGEPRFLGR